MAALPIDPRALGSHMLVTGCRPAKEYKDGVPIAKWFNIPPNMVGKIKADPKDKHPIIGRYAVIRYYTHAAYQRNLDVHILPVLGDFLMVDITPAMISKLLLDFQKSGHAHASAVKLYNILNGIFQMAFLDDTIKTNPMLKVARPKPRKEEKAQDESDKAYTVQQLAYILQCLENESLKWQTYINLVADSGIRRGEACALEWSDRDALKAQAQ